MAWRNRDFGQCGSAMMQSTMLSLLDDQGITFPGKNKPLAARSFIRVGVRNIKGCQTARFML